MTTLIKTADFIESVCDAIQFISYYHPKDFLKAMKHAYEIEQNPSAKNAIAQILVNSKITGNPGTEIFLNYKEITENVKKVI